MNVLITAGGTSEKIDNVRKITNTATGRLGSLIAEEFAGAAKIDKIYYVCAKDAVLPKLDRSILEIVYIESVEDLKNALTDIMTTQKIDAVVHTMAVSDYRLKGTSTLEGLSQAAAQKLAAEDKDILSDQERLKSVIKSALEKSINAQKSNKLSSSIDDLVLFMERTPKIIGMIKSLQPSTILVGFKLLDGVGEETLLQVGYELLKKNSCDFVLANDLRGIDKDKHNGLLISADGSFVRAQTKQEIASKIAQSVLSKYNGR